MDKPGKTETKSKTSGCQKGADGKISGIGKEEVGVSQRHNSEEKESTDKNIMRFEVF